MGYKETFEAAKSGFTMYGFNFQLILDEYGLDKALEFHAKHGTVYGHGAVNMLMEYDHKALAEHFKRISTDMGFNQEYIVDPPQVTVKTHECPMYSGWSEAGLSHEMIHTMCQAYGFATCMVIQDYLPGAKFVLKKFRETPQDYCLEEYEY